LLEVRRDAPAGGVGVGVEDVDVEVPVDGGLQQHQAELAAAEDADFLWDHSGMLIIASVQICAKLG